MNVIHEPMKQIPVLEEADICVLGGSCTGVFAAVSAARLGAKVVIIEKQNAFGGVATSGLVNIWHSLKDSLHQKQIIAGLTFEMVERLKRRNAVTVVEKSDSAGFNLNTEELKIDLDELVMESGVKPYLHTHYCGPFIEDGQLKAIFIENKSGRGAVKAKVFIDATGDGDLCVQLGLKYYLQDSIQPPTACARIYGTDQYKSVIQQLILEHRREFDLAEDWGWRTFVPNLPKVTMHAETHVFGTDCCNGSSLTDTEIEGRRQIRAVMDIIRKYGEGERELALLAVPSYIGIRDTRHIECMHKLTQEDLLYGVRFEDAIANGSYRVDIHHHDKPGITFRYLDGKEVYLRTGYPAQASRWREDPGDYPTFWQVPYRCLVPRNSPYNNVLLAGRMMDADVGAFGAARVMVNLNQMGEAAGVAAYLSVTSGKGVSEISTKQLRETLEAGGAIII